MKVCVIDIDHAEGASIEPFQPSAGGDVVHVICLGPTTEHSRFGNLHVHRLGIPVADRTDRGIDRWLEVSAACYDLFARLHRRDPFDVVDIDADDLAGLLVAHHRPTPVVCRVGGPFELQGRVECTAALLQHLIGSADVVVAEAPDQPAVGRAGQVVVDAAAGWGPTQIDAYTAAVGTIAQQRDAPRARPTTVRQVMEALDVRDGVSDIVLRNARLLHRLGQPQEVLAHHAHPDLAASVRPLHEGLSGAALIFHLWGAQGSTWLLDAVRSPIAAYFHNITPPEFFAHDHERRALMQRGLQQLSERADRFDLAMAPSQFDLDDFVAHRTNALPTVVVPPVVERAELLAAPFDRPLLDALEARGSTNVLFVGRLAPNKRQHLLVDLFDRYWREVNPEAHLWLVGSEADHAYSEVVRRHVRRAAAAERITLTGGVPQAQLFSYLRAADVYVSASEHEGFGIPIAQAMAFDTPVVALARAAVPETMGDSGVLIDEWDLDRLALVIDELAGDESLRAQVIDGQHRNLQRFTSDVAERRLRAAVDYLTEGEICDELRWVDPSGLADRAGLPWH